MPKKVLILGGRGNAAVIAAAIDDAGRRGTREWTCAGYLNDREAVGEEIAGYPVLGCLDEAPRFVAAGYYFINGILRIDGQQERIERVEGLGLPRDRLATFVHPGAYVAPTVELGPGVVIMPGAAVSPGAVLGQGCLVMVGVSVGHDSRCGRYCHLAAQAVLGANLRIGEGVHIGLNATVGEDITIGDGATLGMGAVLTRDMGAGEIWVGNPARFLRHAR